MRGEAASTASRVCACAAGLAWAGAGGAPGCATGAGAGGAPGAGTVVRAGGGGRAGGGHRAGRGGGGGGGGLLLLLLLEQRLLPLLLHLRHPDEVLPPQQHDRREHDGDDGVLVVHDVLSAWPRRRVSAPVNSATIRSNGACSAVLRPIST